MGITAPWGRAVRLDGLTRRVSVLCRVACRCFAAPWGRCFAAPWGKLARRGGCSRAAGICQPYTGRSRRLDLRAVVIRRDTRYGYMRVWCARTDVRPCAQSGARSDVQSSVRGHENNRLDHCLDTVRTSSIWRRLLFCAWHIASASASAVSSGRGTAGRLSRRRVISCTCALMACPYPVTACFT